MDIVFCRRCGRRMAAGSEGGGSGGGLCSACREETGANLSGRQKLAISLGPTVWLAALAVAAIVAAIVWLIGSRL